MVYTPKPTSTTSTVEELTIHTVFKLLEQIPIITKPSISPVQVHVTNAVHNNRLEAVLHVTPHVTNVTKEDIIRGYVDRVRHEDIIQAQDVITINPG
jgi:hypothetical protein